MTLLCLLIGHKYTKRIGDRTVLERGWCFRCGRTRP